MITNTILKAFTMFTGNREKYGQKSSLLIPKLHANKFYPV